MATIKTVPHEILIRFGSGQAHETVAPGIFSGAQYQTATLVLDDATGELAMPARVNDPVPVPAEQLTALLGEQIAAFSTGFDTAVAARKAAEQALADAAKEIASLTNQIDELKSRIDALDETIGGHLKTAEATAARVHAAIATLAG